MDVKPGYQTTEFWITLLSQVIGVAAVAGWVIPAQSTQLIKAITDIIGAIVAIIPAVVYIYNRTWLKKMAITKGK